MPAKRELTMRQLRYMLRLHHDGVSARAIGRTLGVARSTIQDNLQRAQASGIAWPLPPELTDAVLEQHRLPSLERPDRLRVRPARVIVTGMPLPYQQAKERNFLAMPDKTNSTKRG